MKIGTRLIGSFLIVACKAEIVGTIGLINIRTLARTDQVMYKQNTLGIKQSGDANTYYQRLRYNAAEMLLLRDDTQCEYQTCEYCVMDNDNYSSFSNGHSHCTWSPFFPAY